MSDQEPTEEADDLGDDTEEVDGMEPVDDEASEFESDPETATDSGGGLLSKITGIFSGNNADGDTAGTDEAEEGDTDVDGDTIADPVEPGRSVEDPFEDEADEFDEDGPDLFGEDEAGEFDGDEAGSFDDDEAGESVFADDNDTGGQAETTESGAAEPDQPPAETERPSDDPFTDAGPGPATEADPDSGEASETADSTGVEDGGGPGPSLAATEPDSEDPFEEMEGAFEEAAADVVDPDQVWESLTGAEERGTVGGEGERSYAEVSKHDYCERCEYFSGPPNVHCNHEGTDILEFTSMDTVRVVDCPVVTERRGLEQGRSANGEE